MKKFKSTTYREGQRPACPFCKSIQVKKMSTQPKKYPYPTSGMFQDKTEIEYLQFVWNNGYDCKKCGNEFVAIPYHITPLWENPRQETVVVKPTGISSNQDQQITNVYIEPPKKKSGFFIKLLSWLLFIVIAFIVYGALTRDDNKNKTITKEAKPEETQIIDHAPPAQQEDPLKQEFSKDAEEAAHAYIPPVEEKPHKSISDSQDQNDTLSIKTTIRGSN